MIPRLKERDMESSLLLAIKFVGKDHWERHLAGDDELVHILGSDATLAMFNAFARPFIERRGRMGTISAPNRTVHANLIS
jgi:hypothetical protein